MKSELVKIDVAVAALGQDARKILAFAEGGNVAEPGLLWVFNFASNPASQNRELRFWMPEINSRATGNPTQFHGLELPAVISAILPYRREMFHAGELNVLFQLRNNTRCRLDLAPIREARTGNVYSRVALAEFLQRRWLGKNLN